jgi:hypothetical protein
MAQQKHYYALEITAIVVSGLGMLLLLVLGAWMTALLIFGSRDVADQALGQVDALSQDSPRLALIDNLEINAGRVAGVVDEESQNERDLKSSAVEWLSAVRNIQRLDVAYRDGVLERNAQNHARFVADTCDTSDYTNWDDSLGLRVDEGFTSSFSESIFKISSSDFANELPVSAIDYSRLFTQYDAIGVGVAEATESAGCGGGYYLVFHMATVR